MRMRRRWASSSLFSFSNHAEPLLQLGLDLDHRLGHPLGAGDVLGGGEDLRPRQLAQRLAGDRVDDGEPLDGVAEHLDAQHRLLVRRVHLDGVAAHPEPAPAEHGVVAVELQVDEPAEDAAHVVVDADAEVDHAAAVLVGAAHAVDAADRRDHDDVPAGQQRRRRGVAQAVDLVVDRRVLLDVRVARRDVRLGLVVVVVADEVLDPVLGEELPHLLGELGGEALVRRQDQGRLLHLLDRPRDGRRLAGPGDAEQRLEAVASPDALAQRGDRGGLIARRRERRDDPERPGGGNELGEGRLGHPAMSSGPNNRSVTIGFRGREEVEQQLRHDVGLLELEPVAGTLHPLVPPRSRHVRRRAGHLGLGEGEVTAAPDAQRRGRDRRDLERWLDQRRRAGGWRGTS